MTYLPDTRVVIIGGDHGVWNRAGRVVGTKMVQGEEWVSVRLDRPIPLTDRRVMVVLAEHLMSEDEDAA